MSPADQQDSQAPGKEGAVFTVLGREMQLSVLIIRKKCEDESNGHLQYFSLLFAHRG